MDKKQKNTFKLLLIIIIFLIVYFIVRNTYSKYLTMQNAETTTNISKWHILVNNQDITENKEFSKVLNLELDKNPNIAENVIAPTSTGHFNINLDSTGTDTAFKYEFTFSVLDFTSTNTFVLNFIDYSTEKNSDGSTKYIYNFNLKFDISNIDTSYSDNSLIIKVPKEFIYEATRYTNLGSNISYDETTNLLYITLKDTAITNNVFNNNIELVFNSELDPNNSTFIENINIGNLSIFEQNVKDFFVTSYDLNDVLNIPFDQTNKVISGIIEPKKNNQENINNFVFHVNWNDAENNLLNNSEDTRIAKTEGAKGKIKVTLKLIQIEENNSNNENILSENTTTNP